MEQRKITRVFPFESEHSFAYPEIVVDPEPEKSLSLYARVINTWSSMAMYTKNLILSFFDRKESKNVVENDLEAGKRSPKSPMRGMPKETWAYGADM